MAEGKQPLQQEAPWQYRSETPREAAKPPAGLSVNWTASEFIAHHKSPGWYLVLGLAGFSIAALVYIAREEIISPIMILLMTMAFGVFAARQPRIMNYALDEGGVQIGEKHYPYGLFKSFALMDEGMVSSIYLLPLQRFMPGINIYYAPEDEKRILGVLSNYLPFEQHEMDIVDRLVSKIRF
jgi:hypothetical protein